MISNLIKTRKAPKWCAFSVVSGSWVLYQAPLTARISDLTASFFHRKIIYVSLVKALCLSWAVLIFPHIYFRMTFILSLQFPLQTYCGILCNEEYIIANHICNQQNTRTYTYTGKVSMYVFFIIFSLLSSTDINLIFFAISMALLYLKPIKRSHSSLENTEIPHLFPFR